MPHGYLEPKLHTLIKALALARVIPNNGDVIDAGANIGYSSGQLANIFTNGVVIAAEPIAGNVAKIKKSVLPNHQNLEVIQAALGNQTSTSYYDESADKKTGAQISMDGNAGKVRNKFAGTTASFPILTVDNLFAKRTLRFAHWDVEGFEPYVIQGAKRTILRDQPLFVVETHRKREHAGYNFLMREIGALNYACFLIPERCGAPDCRNHICAPTQLQSRVREVMVAQSGVATASHSPTR